MGSKTGIRQARPDDVAELFRLENRAFKKDRFNLRQYRYLVTRARGLVLVAERGKRLAGFAVLLWHKKRANVRLYEIAIDPAFQGRGLGADLLNACEESALKRRYKYISLEVRSDNQQAIAFYEKYGYRISEMLDKYCEDDAPAFRMIKRLDYIRPGRLHLDIPYYPQSLEFTCGPVCLMMAMKYLKPEIKLDRILELNLWKETTLIYTTSGIGGSGPFGLALAARKRGFNARVILSKEQTPFFSSVRSSDRREVIRLVHEDLKAKAVNAGVKADYYDFTFDEIAERLSRGQVPIVLISTYRLHGDRAPHWVVITGYDSQYVYFHDSYQKFYDDKPAQARNVRIPITEFRKMRTYGKDLHKSVIFISRRESRSRKK